MGLTNLPSTIDWCESNYLLSTYIAEYWNTLTGIFLIASGIVFYKNNSEWIKYNKTKSFTNICNILVFVGIGTMLFHGTLYYPFQLMDELPMILLSLEYIYLLLSLETTHNAFHINDIINLSNIPTFIYIMLPVITLSYFINHWLQILTFHITLKLCEVTILVILYKLSRTLNQIVYSKIYVNQEYIKQQRQLSRQRVMMTSTLAYSRNSVGLNLIKESALLHIVQTKIKSYLNLRSEMKTRISLGLLFYGTSVAIWCIENMFCKYIEPIQLHAIWHILSSVGIYQLNNILKIHVDINNLAFSKNSEINDKLD
jgi:hypothetical protein